MSYIVDEKRRMLDKHIDSLLNALRELECDDPNNVYCSNLNYIIAKLLRQSYTDRYTEINEAIGLLECVKLELYRKQAAPGEDQREFEHGSI